MDERGGGFPAAPDSHAAQKSRQPRPTDARSAADRALHHSQFAPNRRRPPSGSGEQESRASPVVVEERSAGRLRVYIGKTRGATAACAISLAESDAVAFSGSVAWRRRNTIVSSRMRLPARIDACGGCLHEAAGSCNGPRHGSCDQDGSRRQTRPMNFQRERFSRRQTGGRRLQPDAVRANGPRVPRPAHAEPQSRTLQSEPELCARSSHGNAMARTGCGCSFADADGRDACSRDAACTG